MNALAVTFWLFASLHDASAWLKSHEQHEPLGSCMECPSGSKQAYVCWEGMASQADILSECNAEAWSDGRPVS